MTFPQTQVTEQAFIKSYVDFARVAGIPEPVIENLPVAIQLFLMRDDRHQLLAMLMMSIIEDATTKPEDLFSSCVPMLLHPEAGYTDGEDLTVVDFNAMDRELNSLNTENIQCH